MFSFVCEVVVVFIKEFFIVKVERVFNFVCFKVVR